MEVLKRPDVKIVNYGDDDDSSSAPWNRLPPCFPNRRRWLHPAFCGIGLVVIIAAIVGHHAGTTTDTSSTVGGEPSWFHRQLLDHFDPTNNRTWSHPYFVSDAHFAGPGHPILVILGGEGPVTQILYPFVSERLAKAYGAYVLQTEHRFYGNSQPVGLNVSNHQLDLYLSPEQALADWIRLIQHVQVKLGCAVHDQLSIDYCPVITIGGSYPGFLSAMMRLNYPNVVDIAYASSAPLKLYEHDPSFNTDGYYDYVTKVAEEASPGCASGVKSTLQAIHELVVNSDKAPIDLAIDFGICTDTFPEYIVNNDIFAQELTMLVVSSNADFNMDYYPPSDETDLVKSCRIFSDTSTSPIHRYTKFLQLKQDGSDYDSSLSLSSSSSSSGTSCFDMTTEIPAGPNATLSSADWSGAGDGETARSWEFQICRDLVVQTGFGPDSMFYPPREWTLQWLTQHCQSRFQVNPQPRRMLHMWHFDDLVSRTSRILFTNGLKDGWSVSSYTEDLSETIVAINFPNGAHHSDLIHEWPATGETDDLVQGHEIIVQTLHGWLSEIKR